MYVRKVGYTPSTKYGKPFANMVLRQIRLALTLRQKSRETTLKYCDCPTSTNNCTSTPAKTIITNSYNRIKDLIQSEFGTLSPDHIYQSRCTPSCNTTTTTNSTSTRESAQHKHKHTTTSHFLLYSSNQSYFHNHPLTPQPDYFLHRTIPSQPISRCLPDLLLN